MMGVHVLLLQRAFCAIKVWNGRSLNLLSPFTQDLGGWTRQLGWSDAVGKHSLPPGLLTCSLGNSTGVVHVKLRCLPSQLPQPQFHYHPSHS